MARIEIDHDDLIDENEVINPDLIEELTLAARKWFSELHPADQLAIQVLTVDLVIMLIISASEKVMVSREIATGVLLTFVLSLGVLIFPHGSGKENNN